MSIMMTHTTLHLPKSLHQRLHIASKRTNKTLSRLAVELLDEGLSEDENLKLDKTYQALRQVKGIVKDQDPEASTTVDDVLYGENGAWRGEPGSNG
jgi:predicted DNA-binding protein